MTIGRLHILILVALTLGASGCFYRTPATGVIREGGSDLRAADFESNWLRRMTIDARENFNRDAVARDASRLMLDPGSLILSEPTAVRVYFIGSQGSFRSSLGYRLDGANVEKPGPFIVFPNAHSPKKLFDYAEAAKQDPSVKSVFHSTPRNERGPVLPGEYVDLGILPAGAQIIFFLDSNMARWPVHLWNRRYTTVQDLNSDGAKHVATVAYQGSPFILLGFEDMPDGGDQSFNDVVFAVELSKATVEALGDARKQKEAEALLRVIAQRRALRAQIMTVLMMALVIGGPTLPYAVRRYIRRRKALRACASAREMLTRGDAREALRVIAGGQRFADSSSMRERFAGIEVQACRTLGDAARMEDLFSRCPQAVLGEETASLMAARAQVETGRTENFQTLRQAWRAKEAEPWNWLTLDSDLLVRQQNSGDAEALLSQRWFEGPRDAVRLARLSGLLLRTSPQNAQQCLERALQLAPNAPEVQRSRAQILERAGRVEEAGEAWLSAAKCGGADPFHRDHYAEYLIRRRDYDGALRVWRQSLTAPTVDILWLKTFFWERMTGSGKTTLNPQDIPVGPLRALLERLLEMPEERFWRTAALDALAQQRPELLARPECLWLRTVQALCDQREDVVLALLSTSQPDTRQYFDTLETALRQMLTYRRMQFLDPGWTIIGPDTPRAWAVPLFMHLDQWVRGELLPENAAQLAARLMGPQAWPELFQAVGWRRAAELLTKRSL